MPIFYIIDFFSFIFSFSLLSLNLVCYCYLTSKDGELQYWRVTVLISSPSCNTCIKGYECPSRNGFSYKATNFNTLFSCTIQLKIFLVFTVIALLTYRLFSSIFLNLKIHGNALLIFWLLISSLFLCAWSEIHFSPLKWFET